MESTIIDIFDKSYELCDQIQLREHERAAYENLCSEVFPGLTFEKWYKSGYWDSELFNPHVLMDSDKIVSAVSVNKMFVKNRNGEKKLYIQIGGVMTSKSYRNQGLATVLLDKIITEWEEKCDGIFLYANEKVKDFYPRFGFKQVDEYQYYTQIKQNEYAEKAIRLNMNNKEDVEKLLKYYRLGNPFSAVEIDNKGLLMFYCLKYNKHDVYFVESENAVVIAGHENDAMMVYDVFCDPNKSLENILTAVADFNTETAFFGFPLIKTKHCKLTKYEEDDNILFILDKKNSDTFADFLSLPELKNKVMFPLLFHS